jgi:division protein CdvB (Snf7/Vps24/ESCRT-III family)
MATGDEEAIGRLQELLARLEEAHSELERTQDTARAVEILRELADLARNAQLEIEQARRETPDALG